MTASIADPLLAGANGTDGDVGTPAKVVDAASSAKPVSYKKCYFTVAWLSLTSLGLLGLACVYSPLMSPKPPGTLAVTGWGDPSCYTVTGGTCMVYGCNADRGAVCGYGHNCVCKEGCTGADGLCYHNVSSYKLVGKNVRFKNVKYSDQSLYAARTWFMEQLRTTSSEGKYADLWNVYKMPGYDWLHQQEMFLFSPVEFPEYAAGVASTKMAAYIPTGGKGKDNSGGVVVPVGSMFIVSLFHLTSRHLLANRYPFNIGYVMNTMCKPRSHPNAVEINGALGQASWYEHHASWEVFGWVWSDPREGGYWVADPPLDIPEIKFCGR